MLSEGQILDGTYRLRRLIGAGGMAVVYEATHARGAGRYAIKVLLENLSEHPAARPWFDREARITSLLRHPNVVQVLDHDTAADGTAYLVMEYLKGESLAQRIARCGRLPLEIVVDIVDQIAAGLAAAHARGIVHRDLKPENVFLIPVAGSRAGQVKILDFGISKVGSSSQGIDGAVCGTPQYMSPEQVEGWVSDIDHATDQFALAVVAYELLVGHNPFIAEDVGVIFDRVARAVPAPAGVRRTVDAVLARGMAKSKGDRYASILEFAVALRTAARVPPRASWTTPEPPPRVRPRPRRSSPALALALVLAAAAIVQTLFDPGGFDSLRATGASGSSSGMPADSPDVVESPAPNWRKAPAPDLASTAARPAVSPGDARDRRPRVARRPSPPPSPSPLGPPSPTLPPDEDATMPLSF